MTRDRDKHPRGEIRDGMLMSPCFRVFSRAGKLPRGRKSVYFELRSRIENNEIDFFGGFLVGGGKCKSSAKTWLVNAPRGIASVQA